MTELFTAIYSHYSSDPLADSLRGMYNTEAPQAAVFPYCVFALVNGVPEFTFTENFEDCLIEFDLFSKERSPVEICNLFTLLKGDTSLNTGFDFLDLAVTDYTTVSLVRGNSGLIRVEDKWKYNVQYQVLLEKD